MNLDRLRPTPENRIGFLLVALGALGVIAAFAPQVASLEFVGLIRKILFGIAVFVIFLALPSDKEKDEAQRLAWTQALEAFSPHLSYSHSDKFSFSNLRTVFGHQSPVTVFQSSGLFQAPNYSFHFIRAETGSGDARMLLTDGIVASMKLGKFMKQRTVISPDLTEAILGIDLPKPLRQLKFPNENLNPVRLESHDFERLYRVDATDPIEARTILTPTAMENLVNFQKSFLYLPSIVISGDTISLNIRGISPPQASLKHGKVRDVSKHVTALKSACELIEFIRKGLI